MEVILAPFVSWPGLLAIVTFFRLDCFLYFFAGSPKNVDPPGETRM